MKKTIATWVGSVEVDDMLDANEKVACAVRACSFASAFVDIESETDDEGEPILSSGDITKDTLLGRYHWALILPLVKAYCQRDVAIMLEASRPMQVDVFGRSVSEIDSEIRQLEDDFSRRVFLEHCWSV